MRSTVRRSLLVVTALLSCAATACGGGAPAAGAHTSTSGTTPATSSPTTPSAFPVTIGSGSSAIRIDSKPTAIMSLSPTATEMLYAIGAGAQVAAVDKYSTYPPQAPRTALTGLQPNVEAIVAKKPDLVVVSSDTGTLTKRLGALHIPVLVLPAAAKLDDVYSEIDELGMATGHEASARQEATKIKSQLDSIASSVRKPAKPVTYYYELEPDYYSVTSDTFVGQLLGLLGLHSIADKAHGAAAAGGYPQLSAEFILAANPDYILLADTKCCHASAKSVAQRPGWTAITAVRDGHVVPLDDDIASRWGPRIVDLLRTVAAAVSAKG